MMAGVAIGLAGRLALAGMVAVLAVVGERAIVCAGIWFRCHESCAGRPGGGLYFFG